MGRTGLADGVGRLLGAGEDLGHFAAEQLNFVVDFEEFGVGVVSHLFEDGLGGGLFLSQLDGSADFLTFKVFYVCEGFGFLARDESLRLFGTSGSRRPALLIISSGIHRQ